MVCSGELSVDNQISLIVNMLELETSTAEIMIEFELDTIAPNNVAICKRVFIETNKRVLAHIEKLQEQGYQLNKVKKSLQLENEILEKELFYMFNKSISQKYAVILKCLFIIPVRRSFKEHLEGDTLANFCIKFITYFFGLLVIIPFSALLVKL